ncbi:hypothetical protein HanPI659440_Chr15g0610431 [Helianthus annuus]|nr:hypothetical protein HanPI659440_Chr15g0610431 [Helianthus annuus]
MMLTDLDWRLRWVDKSNRVSFRMCNSATKKRWFLLTGCDD